MKFLADNERYAIILLRIKRDLVGKCGKTSSYKIVDLLSNSRPMNGMFPRTG